MEKVIEKLEKRVKRFANTVEHVTREIEERTADKEQALAEINEHRTYIEQLKKALATTEKDGGATHEYLLNELERVRRNRERVENNALPIVEKDIESLRENAKVIGEKLEDTEYTLARLKGEVPKVIPPKVWKETACCGGWTKPIETAEGAVNEVSKAVGNIVLGGSLGDSLPICEVKIDMDDTLKILKESFPTIEDFLKFAYGESAVKEHSKNMQEAIAGGFTTGLIARRLKGANLK